MTLRLELELREKGKGTILPNIDTSEWKIVPAPNDKYLDIRLEGNGNPTEVYSKITNAGFSIYKSKITSI